MRNYKLLTASIISLAIVGCSNSQPVESLPPVTGVPLGSFMAFKTDPGLQEVLPGDRIPANKWSLLVPRFVNEADPTRKGERDDWVVLPIALDSHDLCEEEASTLTKRVEGAIAIPVDSYNGRVNGAASETGTVPRCVRSDGSGKFVANSPAL